jgi:enterochelin esterase-like enzyme
LGIHAWGERYGLVAAYERLRRPPVRRTLDAERYLLDERLVEINASLAARPFRGMVIACPYMPNPYRANGAHTLDAYADWIERVLIPAARARANLADGAHAIGIDGVSLGGYVALEVFLRRPQLFGVLGTVQAAIKRDRARYYAERVARAVRAAGARAVHVETSSWDPYRVAAERFSARLHELEVPNAFRMAPGPHNQLWLREVGSLELLLWHDRQLGGRVR